MTDEYQDEEDEEEDIGDLESFMDDEIQSTSSARFAVDVSLSMLPQLDMVISVSFPMNGDIVHLDIEVGKNGDLRVEGKGNSGGSFDVGTFERALRVCEDIPLALEWAARRGGNSS